MKLSTKTTPIGKKSISNKTIILASQIHASDITYNWQAVDIDPLFLIQHITEGKPFAVGHYAQGHRKQSNFLVSEVIALDIDKGRNGFALSTAEFERFLALPFIKNNAFAVIQSASSLPDAYKLRVLFRLSRPITDPQEYSRLVTHVMAKAGGIPDKACKDPARFFFGGLPNRPADYINLEAVLEVEPLLNEIERLKTQQRSQPRDHVESDNPQELVRTALSYIPDTSLDYDEWLAVLMGLYHEFGYAEALQLASEWTTDEQMGLEEKFKTFQDGEGVTIGTVYHLARQRGFSFPRQQKKRLSNTNLTQKKKYSPSSHLDWQPAETILHQEAVPYLTQAKIKIQSAAVAVKSPIGTGKTEWVAKVLGQNENGALWVGHRRSLLKNTADRLNARKLEFYEYQDFDLKQFAPLRLVITANSLFKLIGNTGAIRPYPSLVIDEFEQMLAHLVGETFHGRGGVQALQLLRQYAQQADQVITADADFSDLGLKWLRYLRPDATPQVIINHHQVSKVPMTIDDDVTLTQNDLENRLRRGDRSLLVATDSKGYAKALHKRLQKLGYHGHLFSSDTASNQTVKPLIDAINQTVSHSDYVIYTATLGTGVDIQASVPIVYGFFFNQLANTPREQLQMLGRARHAVELRVFSRQIERELETDPAQLKEMKLANYHELVQLLGQYQITFFRNGRANLNSDQLEYMQLWAEVTAARNTQMLNPRATFIQLAQEAYKLTFTTTPDPNHDLIDEMQVIREELAATYKDHVLKAEPVSEREFKGAQENNTLTDEMRYGFTRWQIESFTKRPITGYHYHQWREGEHPKIKRLIHYHQSLREVAEVDNFEATEQYAIQNRSNAALRTERMRQVLQIVFPEGLHFQRVWEDDLKPLLAIFNAEYEALNLDRLFERDKRVSQDPVARLRYILGLMGLRFRLTFTTREAQKARFYQLEFEQAQRLAIDAIFHLGGWLGQEVEQHTTTIQKLSDTFDLKLDAQNLDLGALAEQHPPQNQEFDAISIENPLNTRKVDPTPENQAFDAISIENPSNTRKTDPPENREFDAISTKNPSNTRNIDPPPEADVAVEVDFSMGNTVKITQKKWFKQQAS